MKDRISEINKEIASLRKEMVKKCNKLIDERDKLVNEQNPPLLSPYIKVIDNDGIKSIMKVDMAYNDYDTGNIYAFKGKIINYEKIPFYHNDFYLNFSNVKEWGNISKIEFDELFTKGLNLIKKDII